MGKTTILWACFVLLGSLAADCLISISPNPANVSGVATATALPPVNYSYVWKTSDGTVLQALSNNTTYAINSTFNRTRIYVYANSTLAGNCSNHTLVYTSAQVSNNSNLFANIILNWLDAYKELVFFILTAGISYSLTQRIGHAALATSLAWAGLFIITLNPFFILGAMTLLVVGLVLTYLQI